MPVHAKTVSETSVIFMRGMMRHSAADRHREEEHRGSPCIAFLRAPLSAAVHLDQSPLFAYPLSDRDRFYIDDGTDDLEIHAGYSEAPRGARGEVPKWRPVGAER